MVYHNLKILLKDDTVYLQRCKYMHSILKKWVTEEEIQKLLKKDTLSTTGVKGIELSLLHEKMGIYYHTLKIDYNNID